jgi:hypothetical protein
MSSVSPAGRAAETRGVLVERYEIGVDLPSARCMRTMCDQILVLGVPSKVRTNERTDRNDGQPTRADIVERARDEA